MDRTPRTSTKRTWAVVAVTVGLMFALAPGAIAGHGSDTITVCSSGCDFAEVQPAIDHAAPGDTVELQDGTFGPTRISITTDDVTLTSANGPNATTVQVAGGGEDPVAIRADDVTVSGITFDHTSGNAEFNVEIFGERVSGVTVENVVLEEGYVLARRADGLRIADSTFDDPQAFGGGSEYGILLHFGGFNNVTIEGNHFTGQAFAGVEVAFGGASNVLVQDNVFDTNNNGVVVRETTDTGVSIHLNDFTGNDEAVDNKGSDPVDATRNWWGSPTGPNSTANPLPGVVPTGDKVAGPANVFPWCVQPGCPVLSLAPSVSLGPSISPEPSTSLGPSI